MATKRLLYTCILVLSTILLALTGCASATNTNTSSGGLKTGVGVDATKKIINLGIISPFSGPVADPVGKPLARGVEVFFDAINAQGGINGYKINLVEKDSQYDPQIQVQQYTQIHNQVLM